MFKVIFDIEKQSFIDELRPLIFYGWYHYFGRLLPLQSHDCHLISTPGCLVKVILGINEKISHIKLDKI